MKYLDILGLPGSGKSTFLRLIIKALYENGMPPYTKNMLMESYFIKQYSILQFINTPMTSWVLKKILFYFFLLRSVHKRFQIQFIKNNQIFFVNVLSEYTKTNTDIEIRNKVFDQVLMTYGFFEIAKNILGSSDILLLDEGISYRPISLFVSEKASVSDKQIEDYFNHICLPSSVIYIKPDIDESLHRMQNRGFPLRIKNKKIKLQREYLSNVKQSLEKIVNYLEMNNIDVFIIKNNEGYQKSSQAVEQIAAFFKNSILKNPS